MIIVTVIYDSFTMDDAAAMMLQRLELLMFLFSVGDKFDYFPLCCILFSVLDIHTVFPTAQIYRKLPRWNQFSNVS